MRTRSGGSAEHRRVHVGSVVLAVLAALIGTAMVVVGVLVIVDGDARLNLSSRAGGGGAIRLTGALARLYGAGMVLIGAAFLSLLWRGPMAFGLRRNALTIGACLALIGVACVAIAVLVKVF